jgi:hypothetical protein
LGMVNTQAYVVYAPFSARCLDAALRIELQSRHETRG